MTHVLLLNASYTPLTVLHWQRAVVLVLDGRAEIVEVDEENPIRSASAEWPRPLVIRLLAMVKIPFSARVALNKRNLYSRDDGICSYCERTVGLTSATIDHVQPRSRGGKNTWMNVVLACGKCNYEKGSQTLAELGWTLRKEPHVPRREGKHVVLGVVPNDAWATYLEMAGAT